MARGIVRRLDELGRVTLPKEMRKAFGILEKEKIGMHLEGEVIHLFQVDDSFKGFARNLDALGRWTLPIELRRTLNCADGQKMEIYVELVVDGDTESSNHILIRKAGCSWCDNTKDLIEVKGRTICLDCVVDINNEVYKYRSRSMPA
ncbi:MAG: binding protein [Herbinix sp.]|jgi:transcriptional pleiotropic regulator of transition state genes|nr:binding protein [Herbinix sp.]